MTDLLPALVGATIALVALGVALRSRGHARDEVAAARAEAAALRRRLEALEERPVVPAPSEHPRETHLARVVDESRDHPPVPATVVGGPVFADLLLRESVLRVASLAHGVRRALAPEQRNRIRFEMGREVKRSRRARRDELKEALREYQARQRSEESQDRSREPSQEDAA